MKSHIGAWSLEVLPDRGGRIISLRHGSGRQWLADQGGWEECFPNVSPGPHPQTGITLPDHGDLWTAPATLTDLHTSWPAFSVQAVVTRELALAEEALRVHYTAESASGVSAAWAMHLLLDIAPEGVLLPEETPVRVDSRFGSAQAVLSVSASDQWTRWGEIRSRLLGLEGGWGAKLFTRPGALSQVRVQKDGELLTLAFESAPIEPTFGLWFNSDAFPELPGRHVGVEPSFGDHDDLASADGLLCLSPEQLAWSVLFTHRALGDPLGSLHEGRDGGGA